MEKTHYFDEIFFYLSKAVIIIPIVTVIIALVIKFSQKQVVTKSQKIPYLVTPTTVVMQNLNINSIIQRHASGEARLNFGGPFYCRYSFSGATISAYLLNSNAQVELIREKTDNLLLKNDCIYFWETHQLTGQKICGISNYLPMLQILTQFNPSGGLVGISNLLNQLGGKNTEIFKNINLMELVDSCKKKEINEKIFELPVSVLFKNEKTPLRPP